MADVIPELLRRGATAVAASRVGIGVVAFAAPLLVSRSWVGRSGDGAPGRVLGRALGGRDLALGLGALIALRRQENEGGAAVWASALDPAPAAVDHADPAGEESPVPAAAVTAATWVGLAALADGLDLVTTARSWGDLPPLKRWLIAVASGGAAAVGGAASVSLLTGAIRQRGRAKPAAR